MALRANMLLPSAPAGMRVHHRPPVAACAPRRRVCQRCARLRCRASAFDVLSRGFESAWSTLSDADDLSARNMRLPLKELRRTLLEADVSLPAVTSFLKAVESSAAGVAVVKGVTPRQQLIKLVSDQLREALGGAAEPLARAPGAAPTVILLAGLQGAGKTTAAAKLALLLQKQGRKPMLVATDTFRPAAIEQLKLLGAKLGVPVYEQGTNGKPADIARAGVAAARAAGCDTVIVDTTGRIAIDEALMSDLQATRAAVQPTETLLVLDAMTGQDAARAAATFHQRVGITGTILTKMDGDARGGAALSVRFACGQPIKFCGTGEKIEDLELFYPERVAGRILGMGDVVSLVEKAAALNSSSDMEAIGRRMMGGGFDLSDFLKQSEMMSSMGSMANLARMIPGVAGKLSDAHLSEAETRLKVFKSLIQSMTPQERAKPELVAASSSRTSRISKGSGRKPSDVASLLSTYGGMRDQMAGLARMLQLKSGADGSPPSMEAINEAARAAQAAGGMPPGGRKSKEAAWREAQQAAKKAEQPAAKAAAPKAKGFGKR